MRVKQVLFFLVVAMVFLTSFVPVFAQQAPYPEKRQDVKDMVLLATTNILRAEVTKQENGILEVSYIASNQQGVQTGIRASLGLADKKNAIVEEQVSREVFSLSENEEKTKTVSMEIPDFLKGEFTPIVTLATESGMVLSLYPIEKRISLSGNESGYLNFEGCFLTVNGDESKKFFAAQGVDVAPDETLTAHCSVENRSQISQTVIPNIVEYRRTVFGKKINEYKSDSVTLAPGEKKEFSFTVLKNSDPQAYRQEIVLFDKEGKKVSDKTFFHYVLRGESATIQNIVLDKNSYKKGDVATITFNYTNSADRFSGARMSGGTPVQLSAVLRVTDENGAACAADKTVSFEGDLFQKESLTIEKECSNPSVSASIQNKDGKTLDSRTVLAKDPQYGETQKSTSSQKEKYFVFVAIGAAVSLFCLIVILLVKFRVKAKETHLSLIVAFVASAAFLGLFPGSASANTYGAYACSGYCVQGMTVTVNAYSVYGPGTAVGVPVYVNLNLCANAVMNADLSYWMNGYSGTFFNRGWGYNAGDNYPQTQYYQPWFVTPNPTYPGTYEYGMTFWGSMREEHCGWYPDFSCPSWLIGYTYYNFTVPYLVTVPTPPPVNGVCGSANGNYFTDPPTANLCASGTPSAWGQQTWQCSGSNGGSTAYCGAHLYPKGGAGGNCSAIWAWTCDASDYSQPLDVHLWEHGSSDFWNPSKFRGLFPANQDWGNPAVNAQCGGYGNHVGLWPLTNSLKDGNWHTLSPYSIDIGTTEYPAGMYNPNIGNVTFNCSLPVTGLKATCNNTGTQATFTWDHTNGYIYAARMNGGTDNIWWWDGVHSPPWPCGDGGPLWWLPLMPPPYQGDYCGTTLSNSFTANVTPGVNNTFWVHRYNGGTAWTDPTSISINCPAGPEVTFTGSVNEGAPGTVLTAQENDRVRFQWSSTNATECFVEGFNASLFGNPNNLPTSGGSGPFSAGNQVKGVYTMRCKDNNGKTSDPKSVSLGVTCVETPWSDWSDCNKSCGGGTQTRSRKKTDCSYETQSQPCNTQACQPGGFKEVAP